LETHKAVFRWVLKTLSVDGLISGRTVAIDATTLEANAAMKSIVRRDNGQSYHEYLTELAQAQLLHHASGSCPFPITCNLENGLVTRFLSR
jgi:hypothetical protein